MDMAGSVVAVAVPAVAAGVAAVLTAVVAIAVAAAAPASAGAVAASLREEPVSKNSDAGCVGRSAVGVRGAGLAVGGALRGAAGDIRIFVLGSS